MRSDREISSAGNSMRGSEIAAGPHPAYRMAGLCRNVSIVPQGLVNFQSKLDRMSNNDDRRCGPIASRRPIDAHGLVKRNVAGDQRRSCDFRGQGVEGAAG